MLRKIKHGLYGWVSILCICLGLWFGVMGTLHLSGCELFQDTEATTAVLQATHDEAMLLIDAAAKEATRLEKKENKTLEEVAALATAKATITTLRAALEKAVDAEGNVTSASGLTALTTFIPPPWNVPTGIVVGMFGTWMKGRKGRQAFKALVGAINNVKREQPSFASSLDAVGDRLKDHMGVKNTAVVDRARKEGKFPVV